MTVKECEISYLSIGFENLIPFLSTYKLWIAASKSIGTVNGIIIHGIISFKSWWLFKNKLTYAIIRPIE